MMGMMMIQHLTPKEDNCFRTLLKMGKLHKGFDKTFPPNTYESSKSPASSITLNKMILIITIQSQQSWWASVYQRIMFLNLDYSSCITKSE